MRIRYRLYGKYVLGVVFFDFSCPHVRWSSVSLCTYHVVCRPCREITEKENEKENEKEKEKSEIRMVRLVTAQKPVAIPWVLMIFVQAG